jgi:hypothetical protein
VTPSTEASAKADLRIEDRDHAQRDEQRRDEDAHGALVSGELDVEVGEPEQPDERRYRGGRADERRVPDLDRLHADEERVGENASGQQGGGKPARAWIAPREVRQVGGCRGRVEHERDQTHVTARWVSARSNPAASAPSGPGG